MDHPIIRIKRFDMSTINTKREGERVGIFGFTGTTGMSYLSMDIMTHNRPIPSWNDPIPPTDSCGGDSIYRN